MNIWILIGIIFVAIILVIMALVIATKKPKVVKKKSKIIEKDSMDFEDLMAIVKNPETSSEKILETLRTFNNNFVIDDENEQKYLIFLSRCLTHKNINTEIFRVFHKEVKPKNKHYKKDLEIIEKKALG